ncbi:AbrB family transcriptional regulator [Xylocopilactobacillus apis]|uniref:Uncharacterized protein n=1 Tax=Xylocopilactobacillus apis TaxID=2932183 RepID=A0AAU9DK09_9LACO|nr:AbrB family transcriptional regulator [Xylocopilactobacillus apis]BDR57147.1 hypothetical protein KIMC2_17090 [Xylocopilactobacillus apis]
MTEKIIKPFKIGDSLYLRISEKDCKLLGLYENTLLKKEISADGKSITFSKENDIDKFINQFYQYHGELMTDLENKKNPENTYGFFLFVFKNKFF